MKHKYVFKYGIPDGTTGHEEVDVELDTLDIILKKYTDYYDRGIILWWDYDEI